MKSRRFIRSPRRRVPEAVTALKDPALWQLVGTWTGARNCNKVHGIAKRFATEKANHRHRRLLRARSKRPSRG